MSSDSTRVEFSPEPVTQSRSPFHPIPTYSPSSISGAATMGSTFSTIGSISSNIGGSMSAGSSMSTPTSSIQLTPTLSEDQVIRLTRAAERYCNHIPFKSIVLTFQFPFFPDWRVNINWPKRNRKAQKSDQLVKLIQLLR